MVKQYYIFRHGETFATKNNTGYGLRVFSASILSETRPVLERIGLYLKDLSIDYNVSSEIKRCRQTVAIVGKESKREFVFDKRLNEFFLETHWHFKKRLQDFLDEMEQSSYQRIAVCTHGAAIVGLRNLLVQGRVKITEFFDQPRPGVLTIVEGKNVREIDFNLL